LLVGVTVIDNRSLRAIGSGGGATITAFGGAATTPEGRLLQHQQVTTLLSTLCRSALHLLHTQHPPGPHAHLTVPLSLDSPPHCLLATPSPRQRGAAAFALLSAAYRGAVDLPAVSRALAGRVGRLVAVRFPLNAGLDILKGKKTSSTTPRHQAVL